MDKEEIRKILTKQYGTNLLHNTATNQIMGLISKSQELASEELSDEEIEKMFPSKITGVSEAVNSFNIYRQEGAKQYREQLKVSQIRKRNSESDEVQTIEGLENELLKKGKEPKEETAIDRYIACSGDHESMMRNGMIACCRCNNDLT